MKATEWIHLPVGFHKDPELCIRFDLPDDFSGYEGQSVKTLTGIIQSKLGLPDAEIELKLRGNFPHFIVRRNPPPPERVTWSDVEMLIGKGKDSEPLLGLGSRGTPVRVLLDDESPHVLISAKPGGGKSNLVSVILSQGLAHGGEGVICDLKRVSHRWAKGLPRVTYARDISEIHDALIRLDEECTRRYTLLDDDEEAFVGHRIYLVIEEGNATVQRLEKYWKKVKGPNDQKNSPAVEALGNVLFMGRAALVHVIFVAQMATARALGGTEFRENFATRILARYSVAVWKMLVPEVWPMPRSSKHSGRVQVVIGGEAVETQIVYLTADEAIRLARSGGIETEIVTPAVRPVDEGDAAPVGELLTLGQAVKAEWIPMKYEALKRARSRDPEFPRGTVTGIDGWRRYTREELTRWYNNGEKDRGTG